jgi:hypothetical protein
MFGSLRNSTANKNAIPTPPPAPAAFSAKKNAFAPPPIRHAASSAAALPSRNQSQVEEPEEEEVQGEWVEVLYDFNSEV